MGYRSDVAYIIKFKSDDDRSKYISHLRSMEDKNINDALQQGIQRDTELISR